MRNFQNNDLLVTLADRGYPIEYLVSRLRGRRARLTKDWKASLYETPPPEGAAFAGPGGGVAGITPENVWRGLLREYRWVYSQMNDDLRKAFHPFFLYTELRTLFICLRRVGDRNTAAMMEILSASLLSDRIKSALLTSKTLGEAVGEIEHSFTMSSTAFEGLVRLVEEEGLRSVEQQLTSRYLVHILGTGLHAVIRFFFLRIIDSRNILGLYKAIRLNSRAKPAYIPGGIITRDRFDRVLASGDLYGVNTLVHETMGIRINTPDITAVETSLYRAITRDMKHVGRDPLGAGLILDYLWRRSIEAMNLSTLIHTRYLEREAVRAELVY